MQIFKISFSVDLDLLISFYFYLIAVSIYVI